MDTNDIGEVVNLVNNTERKLGDQTFTFVSKPTDFSTYSCTTHHICYLEELFVGAIRKIENVEF